MRRLHSFHRWPDVAWLIIALIAFTRGLSYLPVGGSITRDLPSGVDAVFGDHYWWAGLAWIGAAVAMAIGAARSSREELWYSGVIVMCFVWAGVFFVSTLLTDHGVALYWSGFAIYACLGSLFAVLTLAFETPAVQVPRHDEEN